MNRFLPHLVFTVILSMMFVTSGSATTYYIAANGSDSNSGTSQSAAWAHAPGMKNATGNAGTYNPTGGDRFIFRGGDTWGAANFPLLPPGTGGSAGRTIYFGVDQTWYSGSSWTRPIFSGGGTYPGASPNAFFQMGYWNYWIVDNFEFTGMYVNSGNDGYSYIACNNGTACTNFEVKNNYAHGWSYGTSAGVTDVGSFLTVNGQNNATSSAHDNVIDGSDVTQAPCRGPSPCASFNVFSGGPGIIYNNYVNHVVNIVNSNVTGVLSIHDNTFLNTFCSFDNVTHGNAIQNNPPSGGVIVYNNLVEHLSACTFPLNMQAGSNSTNYFFNNVYVDVSNIAVALSTYAGGGISNATFYAFNNSVEPGSDSGSGTSNGVFSIDGDSAGAVYNICNNHGITSGGLYSVYGSGGSYTVRCSPSISSTNTYNLVQSKSAAANDGYSSSQTYPFSPTATTSVTIGTGANLSSICNGVSNSTTQTACLSDTSLGVTEVAGSGGYVVNTPNRAPVINPTSGAWDIGAYGFTSTTKPLPPTGLTAVVQ